MNLEIKMVRSNRWILFSIVLLMSCSNHERFLLKNERGEYLKKVNNVFKSQKLNFALDYSKDSMFTHFPNQIFDDSIFLLISEPPSCPPSFDCSTQYGTFVLIAKKSFYNENKIKSIIDSSNFVTEYSDSNMIINFFELKQERFPVHKCNKWFVNKLPIPYFESYDFGFGKIEEKKEIDGEIYFRYTHVIPSDLIVYVVDAKAGNFWMEHCNENRPESLKEWKNGYSKGIAISENENRIVFWTIIW